MRYLFLFFCMTLAVSAAPPGINVHLVVETETGAMWRGAAPRSDTLKALRDQGRKVTLFDLRHPASADDCSGQDGRLSPRGEAKLAEQLGLRYKSISAMDRDLPRQLQQALARGDVYIHCMYGVNRTGYAVGRYATLSGAKVDRTSLGRRDWEDGVRFQQMLTR